MEMAINDFTQVWKGCKAKNTNGFDFSFEREVLPQKISYVARTSSQSIRHYPTGGRSTNHK